MLEQDEAVILEGRAGFETPFNRGHLTLTDRRLLWEKSLSIDPFGAHEVALKLGDITDCEARGDALVLETKGGQVLLFPQFWMLSVISGNRRTKEWLREIKRAIKAGQGESASA